MTQLIERHHFIHNVFGKFFKDTLDFFSECLYPSFQYTVIGTYDKAVEYIMKKCEYGRETDKPMLPALILNPSGDFLPAEATAGGKQPWRYPNLAPTMIKRLFDPIYRDTHIIVNVGFLRVRGEIELVMLLNSFYEYCDLRMMLLNIFGGVDRIIYPRFFSSFIILPETIVDFEYNNKYTGESYTLDWTTAQGEEIVVPTTSKKELVVPISIKPQYSLVSISDASTRYGGSDQFAEWKLVSSINYEIELPNFLVVESDYLLENISLEVQYESTYSAYNDYKPPVNRTITNFSWDWGLNEDTHTPDKVYLETSDATSTIIFSGDYEYARRYFHIITAEEAALSDSTTNLEITLPEQITDPKILIVNSKYGQLKYGDHYYISDDGWTLVIRTGETYVVTEETCPPTSTTYDIIDLEENTVLELYIYRRTSS